MYVQFTDHNYIFLDTVSAEQLQADYVFEVVDNPPTYNPMFYKIRKTNARTWQEDEEGRLIAEYDIIPLSLSGSKQRLKDLVTQKRWEVMTGGMTLPNDVRIGTDIDDQNRITSVVTNASLAGLDDTDTVDFKAESGWVTVTISEIKAMAGALGQFVQACYTAEKAHHQAIDMLDTVEELAQYDPTQGWPE